MAGELLQHRHDHQAGGGRPGRCTTHLASRFTPGSQVVTHLDGSTQLEASWQMNAHCGLCVYVLDGLGARGSASLFSVDSRQCQSGQKADPLIIIACRY